MDGFSLGYFKHVPKDFDGNIHILLDLNIE